MTPQFEIDPRFYTASANTGRTVMSPTAVARAIDQKPTYTPP